MLLLVLILIILIMNIAAFAAFGTDKRRAEKNALRIPEAFLLLLAFLLGGIGAFAGMKKYRHKTRKWKFRILVPLFMILQIIAYAFLAVLQIYMANPYRPDERAMRFAESGGEVEVTSIRQGYFFDGPGEENAVIFYPGAKVEALSYAPLMHALAENGTDCFLADMPYNFAFFGIGKADGILHKYEYENWYMAGHSLGGVAAADYCEKHPGEIDGMIFLAAYTTGNLSDDDFAVLSVYGENDRVLNRESYEKNRANLPEDTEEEVIAGGNHAGFGDYGPQKGDGEAEISPEEQQAETAEIIGRFLNQ